MRHQGLIFFIVSMEKTGILILFQYTCMCIGVSARKAGKKRREPVGQNITVKVRAYYDNSFKKNKNETEVKAHFDFIFSEIKKKLNKRLVTLNFSVKSAVEMNNLTVNATTSLWIAINGSATLENLKSFAEAQQPSLDTMFNFFTSVGCYNKIKRCTWESTVRGNAPISRACSGIQRCLAYDRTNIAESGTHRADCCLVETRKFFRSRFSENEPDFLEVRGQG
ncbi:uncharacterized protein LOC142563811 isoform X2 [Dermacentor variabilis]|uniref:uncharacterized protein LOC142563811 isoform X2 n=1 Tax=Dermacentor variabilis TaxID=34621 RepID=UPI003F5B6DA2